MAPSLLPTTAFLLSSSAVLAFAPSHHCRPLHRASAATRVLYAPSTVTDPDGPTPAGRRSGGNDGFTRHSSQRCQTQLSSSPPSSSYETWGDGNLIPETFSGLYSPKSGQSDGDSQNSDDVEPQPYLPEWLIDRAATLGYTNPTLMQQRALNVLLPRRFPGSEVSPSEEVESSQPSDVIIHAQVRSFNLSLVDIVFIIRIILIFPHGVQCMHRPDPEKRWPICCRY